MRAAKVDRNHAEIAKAMKAIGASVESLHRQGHGCPDLLVGYRGTNYVLEIKADKGLIRALQGVWMSNWRGQVCVVRSAEEAIHVITQG